MNINAIGEIILAVLTILGGAAGAFGYLRASYAKAQIDALRGDRDDLSARVQRLEADNKDLETELEKEVTSRKALETVVTAKAEIAKLVTILDSHDQRAIAIQNLVAKIARKEGISP